jgi:plastocyanin
MKTSNVFLCICLSIFISVFNFSCSKSAGSVNNGNPPAAGTSNSVSIAGMAFAPSGLTVKNGATVIWKNNDGIAHTVTSNDGTSFNSGTLVAGATFSYIAKTPGTFGYHCTIHSGMKATLIVTP